MEKVRINNDLLVKYTVFRDGQPESFVGATDISVTVTNEAYKKAIPNTFDVVGNVVNISIDAADFSMCGKYRVTLKYVRGNDIEIDALAFEGVQYTSLTGGTEIVGVEVVTVNISGDIGIAIPDNNKIDLNGLNSDIQRLQFDTVNPVAGAQAGQVYWSDEEKTLVLNDGYHTHPIGKELGPLVKNNSGQTILNGQACYVIGSTGDNPTIGLASTANGDVAQKTIGLATMDIANNAFGIVTTFGEVNDIDTSALTLGAIVYLGANGQLTTTEPIAPTPKIVIGLCIRQHAQVGKLFVSTRPIARLSKLSEVHAPVLTDNDVLRYNGTTLRWEVYSLAGKADLVGGKVPSAQLPAYVDDVLEYANLAAFPATGESGKIYVALNTNLTYRWSGTAYVEISKSLALGETADTAYRGDRGKTAYDHSQTTGNPHGTTAAQVSNTPAGSVAATTVQGAINELAGDIVQVETDLNETKAYFSDNIFIIKNKARSKINGSLVNQIGSNTTPLIAINLIYNTTSNGIKIKTGTFRGSSLGVAFFFDVNKNYLNFDSSTTTYSNLSPYPSVNIPANAYYISFFQYNNNESVILSDYGIHRLDDNSDLIKTNTNNISTLITDVDAIERKVDGVISIKSKTFPHNTYYNYEFANVKAGKYIVKFGGEVIVNGNVNLRKNISGVVSDIIKDYNPYLSGNIEIELNEDTLYLYVYIPANLALSTTGTMIVTLCKPNILDNIIKLQEITENHELEIEDIQNKVNSLSISNLIKGDFSGITPFNFRSGLAYSIVGSEVIVSNVGTTGYAIWYTKSNPINGHKYYFSINMKSNTNKDFMDINVDTTFNTRTYHSGNGEWQFMSEVLTFDNSAGGSAIEVRALSCETTGARDTRIKYATFCDLTSTFGAGKEPSKEWMDSLLNTMNNNYLNDIYIIQSISSSDLFFNKLDINNINIELGEGNNITQVVNASMDKKHFITAFNAAMSDYATLCKCYSESFPLIYNNYSTTWNQVYDIVNHNLRKEIFKSGKSFEQCCSEINQALKIPIYRFCDAKIGTSRNFSLNTNFQADEPSAVVSDDGSTLHIYAHLKRISTKDGVNWANPINTPLSGSVTYTMHNNVNYIDGVYYLIGCALNTGGGLYLYTSEDGISFTQRGKLFDSGKEFAPGYAVSSWGNTYLVKNYGENKWYLYIEAQSSGTSWVIHLVTCTDLLYLNSDGTIGNWEISNNNPILVSPFSGIGAASGAAVSSAGNPDLIKGVDNRPIKVDNKYYMLYHSTWKGISHIMYASSNDLINWTNEGVIFDNRDQPTGGDLTSGNADHCIVEFKGRTYLFYTWNINDVNNSPYIKYTIDDRPLCELFKLKQ